MNTRLFSQSITPLPVGISPYEGENTRNYCDGIFKLFSDVCSALLPLCEDSKAPKESPWENAFGRSADSRRGNALGSNTDIHFNKYRLLRYAPKTQHVENVRLCGWSEAISIISPDSMDEEPGSF